MVFKMTQHLSQKRPGTLQNVFLFILERFRKPSFFSVLLNGGCLFSEKRCPEEGSSNLAIAARYVFQPEIFNYLSETPRGKNNEIQLTDAMVSLLQNHGMYGLRLSGKRHDIGNKLDFIKANVALGLQSTDISSELAAYLHKTVSEL